MIYYKGWDVPLQRWFLLPKTLFTVHALSRRAIDAWADVFHCKHGTGAEKSTVNIRFSSPIWVEPSPTSWHLRGVKQLMTQLSLSSATPRWPRGGSPGASPRFEGGQQKLGSDFTTGLESCLSVRLPCRPPFHVLFLMGFFSDDFSYTWGGGRRQYNVPIKCKGHNSNLQQQRTSDAANL